MRSLDEVHQDPQVEASGILQVVDHPVMGSIRQPAPAPLIDGVRPAAGTPAAPVGADTRAVLAEASFSDAEIDALVSQGVVVTAAT